MSATLTGEVLSQPLQRRQKPQSLLAAWPAILALCLAQMVEMLDNSILNVALPTLGRDLHAGASDLQWIVGAYSLTFGGLLMVGGTLGDKIGRRRTLLWGLALFGLAGLSVLLVSTPEQLIAVRALSGVFAAMMAPITMSLLFRLFDEEALRAKAIGLIMIVSMTGFAIGPTLAGLAVEHWPWQLLLVLNAPAALIAWIGVRVGIEKDHADELRRGGVDVPGGLLSVGALGLLLYTFTAGTEWGWGDGRTLGILAGGVVCLIGFLIRENTAKDPMLDLKLLKLRTVSGSAILQTSNMIGMAGIMFVATELFQFAWGWSPFKAGLANLPFVIGMLAVSPVADSLVAKIGHKKTSIVGLLVMVASLLVWLEALTHGYAWAVVGMLLMAVGMRIIMTTGAVALVGALPETHTSIGSAMNDTAQELGNAVGVAVVGTVMSAVVGTHLSQGAWSQAVVQDFIHSQQISFWILMGIVVVLGALGIRTLTDSTETEEH